MQPSLTSYLSGLASADDVLRSSAAQHALSTTKKQELHDWLLKDSYLFTFLVCRHRDMQPHLHMPVSYAAAGLTDLFIWSISQSGFESYVIDQYRNALASRQIDWRNITAADRQVIDQWLDWVDFRITRGWFKSSVRHGATVFTGTADPNTTNITIHAQDDLALKFGGQIAETILSGIYHDLFPERVPDDLASVTAARCSLKGRTISHPQATFQAAGYLTREGGGPHYCKFWLDDLVIGGKGGNATEKMLPGVHDFLSNLTGKWMLTRRVRQAHFGTIWDDNDDHNGYLAKKPHQCLSIVVPAETFPDDAMPADIFERGTPTMPTLLPEAKLTEIQQRNIRDANDAEGIRSWMCNYLLNSSAGSRELFPEKVISDPLRWWMGPFELKQNDKVVPDRYLIARYARDLEGRPLNAKGLPLVEWFDAPKGERRWKLLADWREKAAILSFNPWEDLDRIMVVNPAWTDDGELIGNWSVSIVCADYEMVRYQLVTKSGVGNADGWIDAAKQLCEKYKPRAVAFVSNLVKLDRYIQNIIDTDKRCAAYRSRVVTLAHGEKKIRAVRQREALADPLKKYRYMLDPTAEGNIVREEMRKNKGNVGKDQDGICLPLSLVPALHVRRSSPAEARKAKEDQQRRKFAYERSIDPVLGVPRVA